MIAIRPDCRYQQGCPRRVNEPSMMSSLIRRKAWSSSASHPRMLRSLNSFSVSGRFSRASPVSSTERPRFSFPPGTLALRDCDESYLLAIHDKIEDQRTSYSVHQLSQAIDEHHQEVCAIWHARVCHLREEEVLPRSRHG